ncbi:MAG TPA: hypothetical protein VEA99_02940, partial [Gemmatimonadaceae bacterium]|nr:hypothetical protein [Gemmatimonadaceae bacterium]
RRTAAGLRLEQYDQTVDSTVSTPLGAARVWLRVDADFLTERARFSYSTDGRRWTPFGRPFTMVFQLKTFQGVRFALFHHTTAEAPGGVADFDWFDVHEPQPRGLSRPIPIGRAIVLRAAGRDARVVVDGQERFTVVDRGLGRVALRAGGRYVSVAPRADGTSAVVLRAGPPGDGETFQWMETLYGDLLLLSLSTHRYLRVEPSGALSGDSRGAEPDPKDGTALRWSAAARASHR